MTPRPAHEALGLRFDRISPVARAAMVLTIVALWLMGRRYQGLAHDAILYLGIGLRRVDPSALEADPFFAHGAQDAYTVFPALYAAWIEVLGPGAAALTVTATGQAAFAAAVVALVWRIAPGPVRWWSVAVLAVVSGYYGGAGVFRVAEPFATARTLAEPLVVVALAATLSGRHVAAAIALAAAAVLHPLVALPGLAVVVLWHAVAAPASRRFVVPALLLAGGALVAFAWGPAHRFDAAWLEPVRQRSPHLFLSEWLTPDWARLGWGLCVAWIAVPALDAAVRRMLWSCAAVLLAALACTGIAVDLLDNAFVASLQLWRAHWLLHVLALALVPVAAAALWPRGTSARAAAVCLVASLCFGRFGQPAALGLALLSAIFVVMDRRGMAIGELALRAVVLAASCAAAAGLLFEVQERLPLSYAPAAAEGWTAYVDAATSLGALLPLGAMLLLLAHARRSGVALVAATVALLVGLVLWDARTPWRRFLEEAHAQPNPFRAELRERGSVLWPAPGVPAWFLLGRPSWFSVDQGAGIVFSRPAALEYAAREKATRRLRALDADCAMAAPRPCRIDRETVREVCSMRNAADYLVVSAPIDGLEATRWQVPAGPGSRMQTLRLYACAPLRAGK